MSRTERPETALPPRIGPYRILGLLGEGATSRVYLAEQTAPQREIALKVLRAAALSGEAQPRFRRETELLAQLEHPNIARVYAAGVADTDVGPVPYLAMEYVRGEQLLQYAQSHALDLAGKLQLLGKICRAVHFAHSRGVVHRDLKPANILVDEQGEPRILDFGVAHVTQTDGTNFTVDGQVLGTVPYMSAEQLAGGASRSDPRTDVYSLGVIAYELLSGQLPYPGLSSSTVIEAIAIVRSGRVERLSKLLPAARGDVETVVMKAMAQEATQRYASAAELALDLQRYLENRPIEARPPTAAYLLQLFVRRHRALSAAILVAVLALITGSVVSLRFGISEQHARLEAERKSAALSAVNDFLNTMLVSADPAHTRGRALTVVEVLDDAVDGLRSNRSLHPSARAALAATLARTYIALGDTATGIAIARQERTQAENALGPGADSVLSLRLAEADALTFTGQLSQALDLLAPLLAIERSKGQRERLRIDAMILKGTILGYIGEKEKAEALQLLKALAEEAAVELPPEDGRSLDIAQNYTSDLFNLGHHEEALVAYRQLIERETLILGADHPTTLVSRMDLAERLRELGRFHEAEPVIRSVIADRLRVSGPDHYWTLMAQYVLCNILDLTGRAAEAQPLSIHVVDGLSKSLGRENADTFNAMFIKANIEHSLGDVGAAERDYREVIALRDKTEAGQWPEAMQPRNNLGLLLIEQGRLAEADALYGDLLPRTAGIIGEQSVLYGRVLGSRGWLRMRQARWADARVDLEQAIGLIEPKLGSAHPHAQLLYPRLVTVYRHLGLEDKARAMAAKLQSPAGATT